LISLIAAATEGFPGSADSCRGESRFGGAGGPSGAGEGGGRREGAITCGSERARRLERTLA